MDIKTLIEEIRNGASESDVIQMIADYNQSLQLHKTQVINQCNHVNTEFQKINCNVCLCCGEIIETDV